ncbi:MAG TPA: uroporphyrinogen decarboxylase [Lachnospiraceae bacterium]|nr:uroporphyrinogen decarboxylase [Lachnospiraceae bacterium]
MPWEQKISRRQCTMEAVRHRQTPYIPHNIDLVDDYKELVRKELHISPELVEEYMGNHIQKCELFDGKYVSPGIYRDEYGVIWDRTGLDTDVGIIQNTVLPEPDLSGFYFPPIDEEKIRKKCETALSDGKDRFKFAKLGAMLFERAWSLTGFENFLMYLVAEEAFAEALIEGIAERNAKILDIALEYDFDGVYFGDDYGQQLGLLMSPAVWRRLIKPRLGKLFEKIKARGKYIALHSCGNISAILPDLCEIGLDIYQTVQPEIYDLSRLKQEYGKDLVFYGTISVQSDLPFKKPDEIKEIIRRTEEIMGKDGGFIAAPTHRVRADTPLENFVAMVEAFHEGG